MNLQGNIRRREGFTLIELLVVIALLGLLASIVLVSLRGGTEQAELADVKSFSGQVFRLMGAHAVGIWHFEEGSGTIAIDSSGYGNNGTLVGGVAWQDDGACGLGFGGCLDFDGSSGLVTINDSSSLDVDEAITIAAWIKVRTTPPVGVWYDVATKQAGCAGRNYGLWINQGNGTLHFSTTNCSGSTSISSVSDNVWHHVVVTYENADGNARYYIDGQLDATKSHGADMSGGINASPIRIGNADFDGFIDEIAIYERALTTAEIQKLYAEGLEKLPLAHGY